MLQIINNIPVTSVISIFLLLVYLAGGLNYANCDNDSYSRFLLHSILHANLTHLLVNLYSLYRLSYLETTYGSWTYLILILSLYLSSSYIIYLFQKQSIIDVNTCAVGFSAVILALIAYEKVTMRTFNLESVQELLLILLIPVLKNPKISLIGHLSGILAGILVGILVPS